MIRWTVALVVFVLTAGACATGQLSKHQLRECCMAGAFERCGNGCIHPSSSEIATCREYQTCRVKCSGKNEYMGQPLDSHPNACARVCAHRAVQQRPSIPPRCPANQRAEDLPEAVDELDIGEMSTDGGPDLPNERDTTPDLPQRKEEAADLPDVDRKLDLPSDPDK